MKSCEKCPNCGAEENVIGKQTGHAFVEPDKVMSFSGETLYHVICLKCGTVIRSYVQNPYKLVVKNKENKNE